ncbi:MAG: hypothetical protein WC490_04880 [Candidatus Margulisiibacteriota bacterium]
MGLVTDLGNSINAANASALQNMIDLATAAAGKDITVNDCAIGTNIYTWNGSQWTGVNGNAAEGNDLAALNKAVSNPGENEEVTMIAGVAVRIGQDIQAGGLVELQFKIDQMMAAVQEGIKNTGKVSQTREGAARA